MKLITDLLETETQRQEISDSMLEALNASADRRLHQIAALVALETTPEGAGFLLAEAADLGLVIRG